MSQKSLTVNALLNMIKSISSIVFPLITFPYASRILLPEGMGKVNFANNITSYFVLIATLGIYNYGIRESTKLRNDREKLSCFVKEITVLHICATIIAYLLFLTALFFVPKLLEYRNLLLLSSLSIVFSCIEISWLYVAEEEYEYITVRTIIFQIISIALLFTSVHTKDDLMNYMLLCVVSNVGASILNFIHSNKYIDWMKFQELHPIKHLKPIFVFFSAYVVTSIYTLLDSSMLGFLSSDTEIGYYSAATKINKIIITLITAITTVLVPRLSEYRMKNDIESLKKLFNKAFSFVLYLSIPATAGLILLSDDIIILLSGQNYIPALSSMIIIAPIMIMIPISSLIGGQLYPVMNKEKITLLSVLIGAIMNFCINAMLIPKLGSKGAAIGTLIAESSVAIIQIFFSQKFINKRYIYPTVVKTVFSTIIMCIPLILIKRYAQLSSFLSILICIPAGMFIYASVSILFKEKTALEIVRHIPFIKN